MNNSVNLKDFALAGNATFTVLNEATGNRFTFKVKKADNAERDIYFVSVLSGPDNVEDYTYLGCIFNKREFKPTRGTKVNSDSPSFKAFDWIWRHKENIPETVKTYHENRCGRCGRKLTVPESIKSGFGPECINLI